MLTLILLMSLLMCVSVQDANTSVPVEQNTDITCSERSMPAAELDSLIREAEENQYAVRRVEFIGNAHTRDDTLRRRMLSIQEGDTFTRKSLVKSLVNVSKLKKIIHPVKLSDVTIDLNRTYTTVDITICFNVKKRSH